MRKAKAVSSSESQRKKGPPPLTPEAHEMRLVNLAMNLVEQRLIDGTASSQETTHFLKLASSKASLERELMEKQKELMEAKTKAYQRDEEIKAMYAEALEAMKSYSGHGDSDYD